MKKLKKPFKYLIYIPMLGVALSYAFIYFNKSEFENFSHKELSKYLFYSSTTYFVVFFIMMYLGGLLNKTFSLNWQYENVMIMALLVLSPLLVIIFIKYYQNLIK